MKPIYFYYNGKFYESYTKVTEDSIMTICENEILLSPNEEVRLDLLKTHQQETTREKFDDFFKKTVEKINQISKL